MGRSRSRVAPFLAAAIMLAASLLVITPAAAAVQASAVAPAFTSFTPKYGPVGTTVKIAGSGFSGVTGVLFNGTPAASFAAQSSTSLTAVVPTGATAGTISVRTAAGSAATKSPFVVTAPVAALTVKDGSPGTASTVVGSGFRPVESVDVFVGTRAVATATTDSFGAFRGAFTVPASTRPGSVPVVVSGRSGRLTASAGFLVHTDWNQWGFGTARLARNPFENVLAAANVSTVAAKWSVTKGMNEALGAPVVAGGLVFVSGPPGLFALRTSTGADAWTRAGSFSTAVAAAGGIVYAVSNDGVLHAVNGQTGVDVWSATVGPADVGYQSLTVAQGVVFVGTAAGSLLAQSISSHARLWVQEFGVNFGPPAIADGIAYVGLFDGRVVALRLSDRRTLWVKETLGAVASSPTLVTAPDSSRPLVVVTTGSPDQDQFPQGQSAVWALDASTGSVVWLHEVSEPSPWMSAVAVAGGKVYFGSASNEYRTTGNSVNAIDLVTGAPVWSVTTIRGVAGGYGRWGDPVVAGGVAYFGSCGPNAKFLAFDASNGTLLRDLNPVRCGKPAVVNGRIYLAENTYYIKAFGLPQELPAETVLDDTAVGTGSNQLQYSAGWAGAANPGEYQHTDHYSRTTGATVTVRFRGSGFRYWFSQAAHHGIAEVSIDGGPVTRLDQYAAIRSGGLTSWTSPALANGDHVATIRVSGAKNAGSTGTVVTLDRIDIGRG